MKSAGLPMLKVINLHKWNKTAHISSGQHRYNELRPREVIARGKVASSMKPL